MRKKDAVARGAKLYVIFSILSQQQAKILEGYLIHFIVTNFTDFCLNNRPSGTSFVIETDGNGMILYWVLVIIINGTNYLVAKDYL